jgi:hypothetical protein
LLSPRGSPHSLSGWLAVWGILVALGFRYPLALAVRAVLGAVAAIALSRGHLIAGAIVLAGFLAYLLQVPLIVGLVREKRRG